MAQRKMRELANFQHVRRQALQRDAYRCLLCGSTEAITTHHIRPTSLYGTMREADTVSNLITLCSHHHNAIHQWANTTGQRLAAFVVALLMWLVGGTLIRLARHALLRPCVRLLFETLERKHHENQRPQPKRTATRSI